MSLALLGGSFDPVHRGHLQTACDLVKLLDCEQLALLPAAHSPLKDGHAATPQQRYQMLLLGLQECGDCAGRITVDSRELNRPGRSYTVETLRGLRAEHGPQRPLYWVLGSDSASQLDRWHDWQQLTALCHLVIVERAEQPLQAADALQTWLDRHQCDKLSTLQASPAGLVFYCRVSQLAVSSSQLRENIANATALAQWLPNSVVQYIDQHALYR